MPACGDGSLVGGVVAHAPSSTSRPAASSRGPLFSGVLVVLGAEARPGRDNPRMWLILLEALGAGLLLVGIVWWTMFSGRRGGERADDDGDDPPR